MTPEEFDKKISEIIDATPLTDDRGLIKAGYQAALADAKDNLEVRLANDERSVLNVVLEFREWLDQQRAEGKS